MLTDIQKIFISHASEDKSEARRLEEQLKAIGVEVWVDHNDVHGGDIFPIRISKALNWCDTLLLIWSNAALTSKWVELEWTSALNLNKTIIPCRIDETPIPAILSSSVFIQFIDFESGLAELRNSFNLTKFSVGKDDIPVLSDNKATMQKGNTLKILFLASDADGQSLNLKGEIEKIEAAINKAKFAKSISIYSKLDVCEEDLFETLNTYSPNIVHFSGTFFPKGSIRLSSQNDQVVKIVPESVLVKMFSLLKENIRLVILNACNSLSCAEALSKKIDCAIGVNGVITDPGAIKFSEAFYRAIASGRNVENAFQQALLALRFDKDKISDSNALTLKCRKGLDPSKIVLLH